MTEPVGTPGGDQRSRSLIPGIVLIALGLFFFAVNLLHVDMQDIWPLVLLLPAAIFFSAFLRDRRQIGFLMPATMLTVYAALFFVCQLYDWNLMARLWPTFILAPGLGLFAMYVSGRRDPGLLIPAVILTGISAIFFVMMNGFPEYWPAILILIGVIILLRPSAWGKRSNNDQTPTPGI